MKSIKKYGKLAVCFILCVTLQGGALSFAFAADNSDIHIAQDEYGLSDTAIAFLLEHNVDLGIFEGRNRETEGRSSNTQSYSLNDSILSLINEANAYDFSDEQIEQYVTGLVNSNPTIVTPDSEQAVSLNSVPISSRNSDGPGFEVESKSGYYQATAFATLPTAYNAGSSNSWMFYTVSSPTSNWAIDVGIFYAYGSGGNAWRGCYTAQGSNTVSGPVISGLSSGSSIYFNLLIETSGYLYFRILDGNDFSTEYYALRYYVGSHNIYRTNGIFNRQITMTSNVGQYTNGSYIRHAQFSDAYLYSNSGYSLTNSSNTNSSRRGLLQGTGVNASLTTVNDYSPWYEEDISVTFND